MELKIYPKGKSVTKEPVFLKLKPILSGRGTSYAIAIVACKEDGEEYYHGHLLKITEKGKVGLYNNINLDLGFRLDSTGTIRLEKE